MKTSYDTNDILYKLLKDGDIDINGGIYKDERPDQSTKEDIVINTIELSQEYYPQIGTSNVNIHVTDKDVKIDGRIQKKANSERLKVLTNEVSETIRKAVIPGLKIVIEAQTNIKNQSVSNDHFSNIRCAWVIHA